ncbi:MAG: ABC transporter ATP-binding protein [Clostridia bacterium]|nr:ABC transporter ATP-binding protein [Clostridia bacterium]
MQLQKSNNFRQPVSILFKNKKKSSYKLPAIVYYNRKGYSDYIPKEENDLIQVEHLVKKYGENYAVNDISFTVEEGKVYGFLGPNGAGKSTAMNIITGYIAATSGRVLINGHDVLEEPQEAKRCIGYLPELPPLYMEMTVEEYLTFAAAIKNVPKDKRKAEVERVMQKTSVTHMRKRLCRNLSKGYKQRVGLSQALLGDPKVIILDEPSVGLDPMQIIEMRDLIRGLARDHTVILSSHILSQVSETCDHILIISKGKIVAQDTPENLSRLVAEYETVELTVISDPQTVIDVLKPLEDLSYAVLPLNEPGKVRVTIRGDKDTDVRSIVATALAQARIAIVAMNTISASLEDIFLRLTGNTPGKKPVAKAAKAEEAAEDSAEAAAEETGSPAETEETNEGDEDK